MHNIHSALFQDAGAACRSLRFCGGKLAARVSAVSRKPRAVSSPPAMVSKLSLTSARKHAGEIDSPSQAVCKY